MSVRVRAEYTRHDTIRLSGYGGFFLMAMQDPRSSQ
jgi:hypothetical protein